MIIQENQLRPPSPVEMQERRMWLERFVMLDEAPASYGGNNVYAWPVNEVSVLELIEFHKDHVIPYEAKLLAGYDQELILDWTHLVHCPVCQQWYEKDADHVNDALHTAVEAGTARTPEKSRLLADEKILLDGICR